MSLLAKRLLAVHASLRKADLPHAFGGAIALAYCTQEPRGTRDLDVNVFVGVDRADDVLAAMPKGVSIHSRDRTILKRDGQVRLMWEETPVDVFLDTHAFHQAAARDIVNVHFENTTIPVLGCETLLVFKAMFNRTRDWADIEAMIEAGTIDKTRALEDLRTILGPNDAVVSRLANLLD